MKDAASRRILLAAVGLFAAVGGLALIPSCRERSAPGPAAKSPAPPASPVASAPAAVERERPSGTGPDAVAYWANYFIQVIGTRDSLANALAQADFRTTFPSQEARVSVLADMCCLAEQMKPDKKASRLRTGILVQLPFLKKKSEDDASRLSEIEQHLRRWTTTLPDQLQRQSAAKFLWWQMDQEAYAPLRAAVLICDPDPAGDSYIGWAWIRENAPEAEKPLHERLALAGKAGQQLPPIAELEQMIQRARPPESPAPSARPATPTPSPKPVALDLGLARTVACRVLLEGQAVAPQPEGKEADLDWDKLFDRARDDNLADRPIASGKEVWLLAGPGELRLSDRFALTGAARTGSRFTVELEARRFGAWEKTPEAKQVSGLRGEMIVFPLGVLPDGEYEVEVQFRTLWFDELGHPEKAKEIATPEGIRPKGTPRYLFTVGKLAAPRLAEVGELIAGGAHRTFYRNGWVDAGHSSGGPEPFIHLETAWAPREEVAAIWEVAQALDLQVLKTKYPKKKVSDRTINLRFMQPDGTRRDYVFPMEAPELKELAGLLRKSGYGCW